MHIVISALSSSATPSGVCRHAANLSRALAGANGGAPRVTLIVGQWQAAYFRQQLGLSQTRVEIIDVRIPNNLVTRNAWYTFGLPVLAHRLGADVLHVCFPAPVLARLDKPLVVTLHDLYAIDAVRNLGRMRALVSSRLTHRTLRVADAVVCVSAYTRERLALHYPDVQADVISNIVYLATEHSATELPDELLTRPFLLCVAQHQPNKNLRLLLRGFHRALQEARIPSDTRLLLVGRHGPDTRNLQRDIARFVLGNRVTLLQSLSDASLAQLYRSCDLLIAPSLVEGFCAPAAEAISTGCRVLLSDIPQLRTFAGPGCAFFDLDESGEALAQAIGTALRQPRPCASPERFGNLRGFADAHLALYRDVMAARCVETAAGAVRSGGNA